MWRRASRDRRRFRRKPTVWVGRCAVATEPDIARARCTIEDVSRHGARLVIHGDFDLQVGQRPVIDVERIGPTPVAFRVTGIARHVGARDECGDLRIGVQLRLDAPHERRLAESLFG